MLDPKKQAFNVKERRYTMEQRQLMDNYYQKLIEYGYIEYKPGIMAGGATSGT